MARRNVKCIIGRRPKQTKENKRGRRDPRRSARPVGGRTARAGGPVRRGGVGATRTGPPVIHIPTQPGHSSVLTKEGVKRVKSRNPVTLTGYHPPDSEFRTTGPSYKNPFYLNAKANAQVVQSKYRTRHDGTYISEKHLTGWDERERTHPAPQFSAIG